METADHTIEVAQPFVPHSYSEWQPVEASGTRGWYNVAVLFSA